MTKTQAEEFLSYLGEKISVADTDLQNLIHDHRAEIKKIHEERSELDHAWKSWDLDRLNYMGVISRRDLEEAVRAFKVLEM